MLKRSGKISRERAELIIERCAYPDYRLALREYSEQARRKAHAKHRPTVWKPALSWHRRYLTDGRML